MNWSYRGALGALALAGLGLSSGLAIAHDGEHDATGPAHGERAVAHDEFCPDDRPCVAVDVDADLREGATTLGEDLARYGKQPEECAAAAKVLNERGLPADAFIGRCPTVEEAYELAEAGTDGPAPEPAASRRGKRGRR